MGSFVDLELAITFVPETPEIVLGAFAPYRIGEGPPVLPTLEEMLGEEEYERLDLELDDYFTEDELEAMPLASRAVIWRKLVAWGGNAYIPGPTYATMHWDSHDQMWCLATRTMPKSDVDEVQALVGSLGVFASDGDPRRPSEVGRITAEDGGGTRILSVSGAPFRFE